jgi:hypothetical protein
LSGGTLVSAERGPGQKNSNAEVGEVPKYIFHEADYMKWNSEEYQDHVHQEYTASTVKTGRVYNQTRVRGFTMPGNSDSKEQFGYASNMWMGANSFAPGWGLRRA